MNNQKRPDFRQVKSFTVMRYTINFRDGLKKDCLTSAGAIRVIAFRQRVTPADLITHTTEERNHSLPPRAPSQVIPSEQTAFPVTMRS